MAVAEPCLIPASNIFSSVLPYLETEPLCSVFLQD